MSLLGTVKTQWRDRFGRLRVIAVSTWAGLCTFSLVVGLWMAGPSNILGAEVLVSRGTESSVYITVRNYSGRAWTDVFLDADNLYVHRIPSIAPGGEWNIRMEDAINRYGIPRTPGLFAWEGRGRLDGFPSLYGERTRWPSHLSLSTAEGVVAIDVEPPAE
jgi:hypothetical protein